MKRIVLKFGGTSLKDVKQIKKVAKIIKRRHKEGYQIIAVVSAMSGTTNELLKKSNLVSGNFDNKELFLKTLPPLLLRVEHLVSLGMN